MHVKEKVFSIAVRTEIEAIFDLNQETGVVTMNPYKISSSLRIAVAMMAAAFSIQNSQATPYASELTNNAGNVSFYLNESGGNVTITYEDGSTNTSYDGLTGGTNLAKGKYTFSLGAHTTYSIAVYKVGVGSPTQISVDTNSTVQFAAARGVAVNANLNSPYFGLIYALNSTAGGTGLAAKSRGIYIFNADTSDAFSRSTNASGTVFSSASSSSPYRISVGPDDTVYVGDFSTAAATVWKFDAAVTNKAAWTNVLAIIGENAGIAAGIHGDISGAPRVTGSLATSNLVLYTADAALGPVYNSIYKYSIGAGPLPWSNAPVQLGSCGLGGIAELNTDMALGVDGKVYGNINRVNFAAPNVTVWDTDGVTVLWDSITAAGGTVNNGPDLFQDTRTISTSPDGKYIAAMSTANAITVAKLTNGIPDVSSFFTFTIGSTTGNARQIAWDLADNIYTVSSGQALLRVYSLGGTTTAVTGNDYTGTNGTFSLTTPSTQVSVTATITNASQSGPTPGVFTITRSSVVPSDLSQPVTVGYVLTGTATNTSYTVSGGTVASVTFAPGQTSTNVTITPINDGVSRPTTTVVLTLTGSGAYSTIAPVTDKILIQNTGPQLLFISSTPAPTMYKAYSNDYASFVITRWGNTNVASYSASSYTYGGTAVVGSDYVAAAPISIDPGLITVTNVVTRPAIPPTGVYVGNRTIIVGLGSSGGYTTATNAAALTLLDNANPAAAVLFADPLTDPADAINWNITFGDGDVTNNPANYNVDFGYDLTTDPSGAHGIIPLPPSGATTALRITANKLFNPGSAAGVNVYYTNQVFSGNYAVRFAMNLIQGGNLSVSTEGVLFGINHVGSSSNWIYQSGPIFAGPWSSDGIWYYVSSDPGGASVGDYLELTGIGGTNNNTGWQQLGSQAYSTFAGVFKDPALFTTDEQGRSGVPANGSPLNNYSATNWSDVEIKQVNKVVTMSINKTTIFTYTNTTVWTNGYLMLGYNDPFGGTGGASVGNPDAAAYFSSLNVVRLISPTITGITYTNPAVGINFISYDGTDSTASFVLQSSGTNSVAGPYADVTNSVVSQLANGTFTTGTTSTRSSQFYRIRHK